MEASEMSPQTYVFANTLEEDASFIVKLHEYEYKHFKPPGKMAQHAVNMASILVELVHEFSGLIQNCITRN